MFNKDFYPTPPHVIDMMGLDITKESIILEPSAGKGDILDHCAHAKQLLYCEINPDLQKICSNKGTFLKADFLKVDPQDVSHINQIIMNPPFSAQKAHILHAWKIAPDGCEITSLFNYSMIEDLRYDRHELKAIIYGYGTVINLGNVFNLPDTERKTDVNIGLLKLYKPISNNNANFEGFYMDEEPETRQENGICTYNEIQALVNAYISASKCWDEFEEVRVKMSRCCSPVGMDRGFSYSVGYNEEVTSKEAFLKALQKHSWVHIFNKMNLNKYLTSGAMKDVNKFVEHQHNIPFTVKNIYKMFEIIIGTKQQNFDKALIEAVDNFTKHTHENRHNVEGWKTNSGYMLNQKFIISWCAELNWGGKDVRFSTRNENIRDMEKVLCNITGKNFDTIQRLNSDYSEKYTPGQWYDSEFFKFKLFKKRSGHFMFKDVKVWEQLNRAYAKIKGEVLPENTFRGQQNRTEQEPMEGGKTQEPRTETPDRTDIFERLRNKYKNIIPDNQTNKPQAFENG